MYRALKRNWISCRRKLLGGIFSRAWYIVQAEPGKRTSAYGTTIKALSTNTVFVRCCATTAESGSWNLTKQTREETGKGESSGGKRRSSSILPRKPKRVRICSELALGETLVTWITSVPPPPPPPPPPPGPPLGPGPAVLGTMVVLLMALLAFSLLL